MFFWKPSTSKDEEDLREIYLIHLNIKMGKHIFLIFK